MFERHITEGVLLHDKRGKPFWKLAYVCALEGCDNVLEECWCFSQEEDMLEAKKLEFYCSTACWMKDQPGKFEQSMAKYRKTHGPETDDYIDWDDENEVLESWEEWLSEGFDGSDIADMIGADMECPI